MKTLKQYFCKHNFNVIGTHSIINQTLYQCDKCNVFKISHNSINMEIITSDVQLNDWIISQTDNFVQKEKALSFIQKNIDYFKDKNEIDTSYISDGYHTFDELYYHRAILFSIICNSNKDKAWKSKLHDDNTMFDNMFIVGITTPKGDYTYHYSMYYWSIFDVKILDKAPKWDGHKPSDITRLFSLLNS